MKYAAIVLAACISAFAEKAFSYCGEADPWFFVTKTQIIEGSGTEEAAFPRGPMRVVRDDEHAANGGYQVSDSIAETGLEGQSQEVYISVLAFRICVRRAPRQTAAAVKFRTMNQDDRQTSATHSVNVGRCTYVLPNAKDRIEWVYRNINGNRELFAGTIQRCYLIVKK
jgi:hypothetical protein